MNRKIILSVIVLIIAVVVYLVLNNQNKEAEPIVNNRNNQEFVCNQNSDQFKKSTGLIISDELKEKYNDQIKELLNSGEENSEKYFNLAILYRNIDDLEKSCEMFIKSVKLNENNFLAFSGLGTVFQEMQDYEQAERAFKKTIEINSKHINTYNKIAFLYRANLNKTKEEIIKFYEDAIIETSGDVNLAREYVSYLEEVKEYEKAIEIWKALAERESGGADEIQDRINELRRKIAE